MYTNAARRLSILIAALAALASAVGLLWPSLYRDNAFVTTTWNGNDAVTLILAVPLLGLALWLARGGSRRALLLWLGMLDYMLYNYAFYLFAARFNALFLVYVALVGCSMFALIFGLVEMDASSLSACFSQRTPRRWIGGYMLFVGIGLTLVYVMQSIVFITKGELPSIVLVSEHPTSIVFALDLTILVPWMILGGVWLIQRRPWGYVMDAILTVKGALYTFVLTVNTLLVMRRGLGDGGELPMWATLTLLGLVACLLHYGNLSERKDSAK
jgi:hypothetical protein